MECKDTREKLCAYSEGAVSPEERRLIEEHLNACQECRTHLEDLRKTGELVKDLPAVEPPVWLTPKIMFRIRGEGERKKGIFQKLFYPLHIKVPIEALATVLIAVIAVYVFRAVDPEMQTVPLPAPTKPMISREEAPQPSRKDAPDSVASGEKAYRKETKEKETGNVSAVPHEDKPALPRPAGESQTAEKREPVRAPLGEGIKAAVPLRKQEPAALKQAPHAAPRDRESMALSDAAKDTRERKKLAAAPKPKEVAAKKPRLMMITVNVNNMDAAGGRVESLLNRFGARKITKESLEGREILTTELKAPQVKEFLEKLKAIGEVKEKGLPPDISEEDVTIRVELVSSP